MPNRSSSHYPDIGALGEDLIAKYLQAKGWLILHRRWHCRWGELDIIAQPQQGELVFVEVKTRSPRNWDANGLLAITSQKQAKLWQAAELFLAASPELADGVCRFDVALVSYQRLTRKSSEYFYSPETVISCVDPPLTADKKYSNVGQCLLILEPTANVAGYRLILQEYIESAFSH